MKKLSLHRPVSLGRITYMNVAPVYYGLDTEAIRENIKLISGPPNTLNQMMIEENLDISPVSSAACLRNASNWLILPDLAIACHQQVLSVLLVSRLRMEALTGKRLLISDESASARDLCRLIFSLKGVRPEFVVGRVKNPLQLPEDIDAALVIGDTALSQPWDRFFPIIHDLGTLWWEMTGLPFVFAVWAVRRDFARRYPQQVEAVQALLQSSRRLGLENMEQIAEKASAKLGIDVSTARLYYESLGYSLGGLEKQGLELFNNGLHQQGITKAAPPLIFFGNEASNISLPYRIPVTDQPSRNISPETAGCCPAL